MSDLTVYAEALIATIARAFYDDEAVCLIDVLIRDKYLRDDDMSPRLNLPAKKLRSTLQFLQEEHIVKNETVDDLAQGGSQATKFWYIDYNHAVHTIRLRLHLLRKNLEQEELRARSNSFYLCPGYKEKRCNGRYTEEEAQQVVDTSEGLFLCHECYRTYESNPNAPPKETYTLQLIDNSRHLKEAIDNLRRVTVQLSGKTIGNHQLRTGIYDLLQKVRGGKGKSPITSNLPSENFALGIGSKRLAGTGRTAGIKARKLEQQGVVDSTGSAKNYLVGGTNNGNGNGNGDTTNGAKALNGNELVDWTFLKSAMGNEIAFTVEKGGGARANLLATKRRRRLKLLDAAASRVGATLPLHVTMREEKKRRLEKEQQEEEQQNAKKDNKTNNNGNSDKKIKKKNALSAGSFSFLQNNIGRERMNDDDDDNDGDYYDDKQQRMAEALRADEEDEDDDDNSLLMEEQDPSLILSYESDDILQLSEESRKAAFQAQYKQEMNRQMKILKLQDVEVKSPPKNPNNASSSSSAAAAPPVVTDVEDDNVEWEDG